MIFFPRRGHVVTVIRLKILMINVRSPAGRVHVRGIEDNAIDGTVFIGKLAAIGSRREVSRAQLVKAAWYISPEYTFAIGYIGNNASRCNV